MTEFLDLLDLVIVGMFSAPGRLMGPSSSGTGIITDGSILMETGDILLLETGDELLLE